MRKRVLIGLLAVSVLAIWGSAAHATNRVLGVIVKHSDLTVEVHLCGNPLVDTLLTLDLQVEAEIACRNPEGHVPNGQPGHPTFSFPLTASQVVPSADFNNDNPSPACAYENNNVTTLRTFTFPLPPEVTCMPKWTKVPNSELISVAATATWSCTTTGPASDCQNANDTIEAISVACADTPHTEEGVPCDDVVEHVGPEGAPPPPLVEPCVDIYKHCEDPSSPTNSVLETVCGAGVHVLDPFTAENISYVTFQGASSVVLHHCFDESGLSGATWEIFGDTNLCSLEGGCCSGNRWNDRVCSVEIKIEE